MKFRYNAFNLPFLKIEELKTETLRDIWEKESAWQLMRGGITISQIDTCNSSSSTLLYKAGVPLSRIKDFRKQISGLVWGFGDIKPWTVEEQSKAVQRQREFDQLRNEMISTIILNKY